ncbi:hypothetical protein HELRODRAFT_160540 [Helobdella robusta]|uniref:SH2 domain-containing protein n=1 Tax=Helobdella robusta TaxID=6412 RepID=T1EQE1_HELRO|nr:hypothetical protein HELRODRAFT_160540 [Helobdella robusta]ESO06373.1 hypothetical protein HELRODRAFT_160540 [Helobdella robusta]
MSFDTTAVNTGRIKELWSNNEEYLMSKKIVDGLKVTNDTAERGVKLITDYNSCITKEEDQKYLLQVIAECRTKFPEFLSSTYLKPQKKFDFLDCLKQMRNEPWYWGPCNGEAAQAYLHACPDGTFMLRDSSDDWHVLTVSYRVNSRTRHVRIDHCRDKICVKYSTTSTMISVAEFLNRFQDYYSNYFARSTSTIQFAIINEKQFKIAQQQQQQQQQQHYFYMTKQKPQQTQLQPPASRQPINGDGAQSYIPLLFPLMKHSIVGSLKSLCRTKIVQIFNTYQLQLNKLNKEQKQLVMACLV